MSEVAEASTDSQLDFSTETHADLFEWMAGREEDKRAARGAFAEFHKRHSQYFYRQCEIKYKQNADDVFQETMARAYEQAGSFRRENIRHLDADSGRRVIRGWLATIARNAACDLFKKKKNDPLFVAPISLTLRPDIKLKEPSDDAEEPRLEMNATLIAAVREEIQKLTPADQDILWTQAHRWCPGEETKWSPEDLDSVAQAHGLKRENLRQRKLRLLDRLTPKLEKLLPARPGAVSN